MRRRTGWRGCSWLCAWSARSGAGACVVNYEGMGGPNPKPETLKPKPRAQIVGVVTSSANDEGVGISAEELAREEAMRAKRYYFSKVL